MYLILIGVLLALVIWLFLKPTWLPPPPHNRAVNWIEARTTSTRQTIAQWRDTVQWPFQIDPTSITHFKQWAIVNLPSQHSKRYPNSIEEHTRFTAWLDQLADKPLEAYARSVSAFCQALGFEPEKLWAMTLPAEQIATLTDSVLLHALAHWKGGELKQVSTYTEWQANPHKHPQLTRQLFSQLIARGVVVAPPEMMLASDQEQLASMTQAIQHYIKDHPDDLIIWSMPQTAAASSPQ